MLHHLLPIFYINYSNLLSSRMRIFNICPWSCLLQAIPYHNCHNSYICVTQWLLDYIFFIIVKNIEILIAHSCAAFYSDYSFLRILYNSCFELTALALDSSVVI